MVIKYSMHYADQSEALFAGDRLLAGKSTHDHKWRITLYCHTHENDPSMHPNRYSYTWTIGLVCSKKR